MTPVKHNLLDKYLKEFKTKPAPQLFLIYGDSFLIKKAFDTLRSFLLNGELCEFAIETLEGGSVSMADIIEELCTYSFVVKQKIVAVKNIPLFQTRNNPDEIGFSASDHHLLSQFLENGMPENHCLILTCSNIDKRLKFYKTIEENGLVIDCSVSQGSRKADLDDQNQVLTNIADPILSSSGKTIVPRALSLLVELTGFNPELFSQNLEKLITYVGKNTSISIEDVKSVIVRDKKDPVFNLTNALMDKDVANSIHYLNSLLDDGFHPLQILKSFENQIRKLLLVKCFLHEMNTGNPMRLASMGFNIFQQNVLPRIIERDKFMNQKFNEPEIFFEDKKTFKKDGFKDLLLAPNPKNPYPVFQVFLKSENFSLSTLNHALVFISNLDYKMKTSAIDAKTQMENFIIQLCSKGGFDHDA